MCFVKIFCQNYFAMYRAAFLVKIRGRWTDKHKTRQCRRMNHNEKENNSAALRKRKAKSSKLDEGKTVLHSAALLHYGRKRNVFRADSLQRSQAPYQAKTGKRSNAQADRYSPCRTLHKECRRRTRPPQQPRRYKADNHANSLKALQKARLT